MASWEEDVIYTKDIPQLVLWARYIDDILLLWYGQYHDLEEFIRSLNANQRGIHLNYATSQSEINFLDLKITARDKFVTSTFFKGTDRNSFIPVDSCHFGPWLRSVPKSQYMRLRRNCSDPREFLVQADVPYC